MLSKAHLDALAAGDTWLEKGANFLVFGPPGQREKLTAPGPSATP